jgi:type II secretory pathway component GspD/PulD (secretin)
LSRSTVRITPNRDQHCIVVAGSKADLERAEKVIKEIEAIRPVNPREVVTRIYEIRHSTATEIATILNKVFEGRADSSEADRSSSSSQPGGYSSYYSPYGYGGFGGGYSPYGYGGYGSGFGGDADRGGDRGRGFSPGGFGSSNPYIDRSWYSSSSSSSSSRSSRDRRSGSSGSSSPSGPTVGLRAAVPDTRTNRVIVTAPQGEFVNIEKVIEEIDRPSRSGGIIEILPVPQGRDIQKILRRAEEIYKATRPIAEGN